MTNIDNQIQHGGAHGTPYNKTANLKVVTFALFAFFADLTIFALIHVGPCNDKRTVHKNEYLPASINAISSSVDSRPSISFNSGNLPNCSIT